jgi:hypothetical protein
MCKTFCRRRASTIFHGTHPTFFDCKLMALSPRVKRPDRETDHFSPSLTVTDDAWSSTFTTLYALKEWSFRNDRAGLHLL